MQKLLFFLSLILIAGCGSGDVLSKAWIYQEDENTEGDGRLSGASFIDLQKDGTYTCNLEDYQWGKWYRKKEKLVLVNNRGRIYDFKIESAEKDKLVLLDKIEGRKLSFAGFSNRFDTPGDNPFSRQNNRWRLKASGPETDQEITARLKNHFTYWEKYFAWGHDVNAKSLDVRSLPSPIKMYGNGFELLHPTQQSTGWTKTFYDTSDCRKAYEKLYYAMYRTKVKWMKSKNRYEKFADAFRQVNGGIRVEDRE
jgi:hypothetical protein